MITKSLNGLKLTILISSIAVLLSVCVWKSGGSPEPSPVGKWTWESGANVANEAGTYGTQGTGSVSNVPGARAVPVTWIDSSNKLWLFGGSDFTGDYLNDLWEYESDPHKWTWVSGSNSRNQAGVYGTKGTAAPSNVPGARDSAVAWFDPSGKLWLFGGTGLDSAGNLGNLNDLWKFDLTTRQWTWVSGSNTVNEIGIYGTKGAAAPSNIPGARGATVSLIDSQGKLWLFGGTGLDSAGDLGSLNDLWKFDPATLQWTWLSGSNLISQGGVYGTKGVAASSNMPGARKAAVSWIDAQGKFWVFGGTAFDGAGLENRLNDLWNFDPATLEWTWVSGGSTGAQVGIYGTKGTASTSNVPGGRESSVSWLDSSGKLWLFGGLGDGEFLSTGLLNDLWKFNPATLEWTWMSGSKSTNQAGVYGTWDVPAASNVPGAREKAVAWFDPSLGLWIFGGITDPNHEWRNDLLIWVIGH